MKIKSVYKKYLDLVDNIIKKHELDNLLTGFLIIPGSEEFKFDLADELDKIRQEEKEEVTKELYKLIKSCKNFDQEDLIPGIRIAIAAIETKNG